MRTTNWVIVIKDGYSSHAYRLRASDRLSVHMVYLILRAGLRLLGVGARLEDLGDYLGQTEPVRLRKSKRGTG